MIASGRCSMGGIVTKLWVRLSWSHPTPMSYSFGGLCPFFFPGLSSNASIRNLQIWLSKLFMSGKGTLLFQHVHAGFWIFFIISLMWRLQRSRRGRSDTWTSGGPFFPYKYFGIHPPLLKSTISGQGWNDLSLSWGPVLSLASKDAKAQRLEGTFLRPHRR